MIVILRVIPSIVKSLDEQASSEWIVRKHGCEFHFRRVIEFNFSPLDDEHYLINFSEHKSIRIHKDNVISFKIRYR